MAFAGLKKQINKANQYMTEKMGGTGGTKLDVDFIDMERKTDVTNELVEDLQIKTKEFLQPNPTARAKMAAVKGISKLSGQAKASTYPQPEGLLGDCLLHYGKKLGDDSIFGQALLDFGESLKQMAEVKYSLDDNAKQNFLEPLHHLQMKDLKEVMHHRKKLQGRRLDFDCKRRRQAKDEEVRQAEEKFAESLHLAQLGMFNLLENDVEQISQLTTFAEALLEYHQQCAEIMKYAVENLREKRDDAAVRPKHEFIPKTLADLNVEGYPGDDMNGANNFLVPFPPAPVQNHNNSSLYSQSSHNSWPKVSPVPSPSRGSPARSPMNPSQPAPSSGQNKQHPCCTALYDFDPENPTELGFKVQRQMMCALPSNTVRRLTYDMKTKQSVILYAEVHGNRPAERHFSVAESLIRRWRQQRDKIFAVTNLKKKTFRGAKEGKYPELDNVVANIVRDRRSKGLPVSREYIVRIAKEEAEEMNIENFKASGGWLQKFMLRSGLSLRRRT